MAMPAFSREEVCLGPVFSPDETTIAGYAYRAQPVEIYVMKVDDTNQQRITNDPGFSRLAPSAIMYERVGQRALGATGVGPLTRVLGFLILVIAVELVLTARPPSRPGRDERPVIRSAAARALARARAAHPASAR